MNIESLHFLDEKFLIRKAKTERLQKSAIINMQRLLNNEEYEKRKITV